MFKRSKETGVNAPWIRSGDKVPEEHAAMDSSHGGQRETADWRRWSDADGGGLSSPGEGGRPPVQTSVGLGSILE